MTKGKRMTPADRDFFEVARAGDQLGVDDALVEMQRDPKRWFCLGIDEHGMPRVFGRGDTEAEAAANAREGAEGYITEKAAIRVMAPVSDWTFITYAPDPPAGGAGPISGSF